MNLKLIVKSHQELGFQAKSAWLQNSHSFHCPEPSPHPTSRLDPTWRLGNVRSTGVCVQPGAQEERKVNTGLVKREAAWGKESICSSWTANYTILASSPSSSSV